MLIQRFAAVALGIMMGTSLLLQTGTVMAAKSEAYYTTQKISDYKKGEFAVLADKDLPGLLGDIGRKCRGHDKAGYGTVFSQDCMKGPALGSVGADPCGDIRTAARKHCLFLAVYQAFPGFPAGRMVKPQKVPVVDGDDVQIGKVFMESIQGLHSLSVRIAGIQHVDHLVHGGGVGGHPADQGINLSLPSVYVIKQADPQGKHQETGGNREKAEK